MYECRQVCFVDPSCRKRTENKNDHGNYLIFLALIELTIYLKKWSRINNIFPNFRSMQILASYAYTAS